MTIEKSRGQTITATITEINQNVDFPGSVFDPPEEVLALLEK
jgi:hypothetical protein